MKARFAGKCERCGGAIDVGQSVDWSRQFGVTHQHCPESQAGVDVAQVATYWDKHEISDVVTLAQRAQNVTVRTIARRVLGVRLGSEQAAEEAIRG